MKYKDLEVIPLWVKDLEASLPRRLTTQQAAEALGCSSRTVYERWREGRLPRITGRNRFGKSHLYAREDVIALLLDDVGAMPATEQQRPVSKAIFKDVGKRGRGQSWQDQQ